MRKFIIIGLSVGAGVAAGLLAGFAPQVEGPHLRRKAEMHIAAPGPQDMPAPAPERHEAIPSWQVFGPVGESGAGPDGAEPAQKSDSGAGGTSVAQTGAAEPAASAPSQTESASAESSPPARSSAASASLSPAASSPAAPSSSASDYGAQGAPGKLRVSFEDEAIFLALDEALRQMDAKFSTENFDPLINGAGHDSAQGQAHAALAAPVPADFGEALDGLGRPLRFAETRPMLEPECFAPESREDEAAVGQENTREAPPARVERAENASGGANYGGPVETLDRARRYRELVRQYAARYQLKEDLVLAIIRNESNFSTTLVSSKSAMGLMQLLPGTASGEVHKFIYGRTGSIGYAELTNPETNIRFGTAYLHLLLNRHLGDIENEKAREYCAIASYNMGPNRFLRMFDANRDKAVEIINGMTPEEVYARLTSMPIAETRSFVAKVTRARDGFAEAE